MITIQELFPSMTDEEYADVLVGSLTDEVKATIDAFCKVQEREISRKIHNDSVASLMVHAMRTLVR